MLSNFTVGLLLGIGLAGWVYAKIYRSTGGNTQNALIVAVTAGVIATIALTMLLGAFF